MNAPVAYGTALLNTVCPLTVVAVTAVTAVLAGLTAIFLVTAVLLVLFVTVLTEIVVGAIPPIVIAVNPPGILETLVAPLIAGIAVFSCLLFIVVTAIPAITIILIVSVEFVHSLNNKA